MEKESKERRGICLCITDSLCCIPEANTILYINYIPIKIKKKKTKKENQQNPNEWGVVGKSSKIYYKI